MEEKLSAIGYRLSAFGQSAVSKTGWLGENSA